MDTDMSETQRRFRHATKDNQEFHIGWLNLRKQFYWSNQGWPYVYAVLKYFRNSMDTVYTDVSLKRLISTILDWVFTTLPSVVFWEELSTTASLLITSFFPSFSSPATHWGGLYLLHSKSCNAPWILKRSRFSRRYPWYFLLY